VRTNIDVPSSYIPEVDVINDSVWETFTDYVSKPANGKLFLRNTADYFFYNRNTTVDWRKLPPFLLGGRAFGTHFSVALG
jgi:hypothetical protein